MRQWCAAVQHATQTFRNMTGVELPEFKKELDAFLATVPDEPQSPGYTDARQAESNSLVHMIPTIQQGLLRI